MVEIRQVGEVFTPGRIPEFTYNPRDEKDVEGTIRRFLQNRGAALTVSGPTKSGKTVVVDRLLPRDSALWVSGGDLRELDDLWMRVCEFLDLYDQVEWSTSKGSGFRGSINARLGTSGTGLGAEFGSDASRGTSFKGMARRPLAAVARDALADLEVPVVIDDFHYVPDALKLDLVRAIKGIIATSPVVLIAVPHDAFSVVRSETDMLGRLWQLQIMPWSTDELVYIARLGFDVLNVSDRNDRIAKEFAKNSLGAPFLMQQLCLDYCIDEGIPETQRGKWKELEPPKDLQQFYRNIATRYIPGVFDALRRGPRTKGQPRLPRKLKSGGTTDIYGAVLYGISKIGAVREVSTQDLSRAISELFEDAPTTQNVAFALGQMNTIAENGRGASDPALAYRDDTLFMSDPFLSFYLRFGQWDLPSPPRNMV
ncbi:hypothetical protein GCM10023168_32380 [Fodinibacter luteus]|uniref:ATP-binding protein n=1 Tax=Fodinibacter luteus TaxID=552064 RepID=A0ABP8KNU1_9MICO